MYKKKIALACATLVTAGLLLTSCVARKDGINTGVGIREEVYKVLERIPKKEYALPENDYEITVKADYGYFIIGPSPELEVRIENKRTGDVLRMIDNRLNGVDFVTYNGIRNGTEGMDDRFDEALRKIKPSLDLKIEREVQKVKENTKLK